MEDLDRTKEAPWHGLGVPKTHDATQARTHGLHDMCDVHPVTVMTWGLVRPTLPCASTRVPKPCAMSQLEKLWAQRYGSMGH